jgi:hypothetical protein
MTFLFGNYEINYRQTKEIVTDKSGNVYRIGFYTISYIWVHALRWHRLSAPTDANPILEATYRMSVELDPSLIPSRALPHDYTDSYSNILVVQDIYLC